MKLSIDEVTDIIEVEGLDYAITDYLDPDRIQNEDLADLVSHAQTAISNLQEFLDRHATQETDNEL